MDECVCRPVCVCVRVCVCVCTCSDHPLDADPGRVDLLGELVDGLCWVFIRIRINIGLYSWERDCGGRERDAETMNNDYVFY